MDKTIHELINMKARREELELEIGTPRIDYKHMATLQKRRIAEDAQAGIDPWVLLELVNERIRRDEVEIKRHH